MKMLEQFSILDTDFERSFDRITQIGARMFNIPICLVSLVDRNRQWFKSCIGLDVRETGRDSAFCTHTIMPDAPDIFIVRDTLLDPRFFNNPLVTGDPFIRYAQPCPTVPCRVPPPTEHPLFALNLG
jgi:GAF domain-containing protein